MDFGWYLERDILIVGEATLLNGGDCFLHWHSSDRVPRQDFLHGLQQVTRERTITAATYSVVDTDDILLCGVSTTITMLPAIDGREIEVVMTGTDPITVNLTTPDLVYGESSVIIEEQGTALRFKAISGGWVFI